MSYSLYIWKTPAVTEPEEAAELLRDYYETGATGAFQPSDELSKFFEEQLALWPRQESEPSDRIVGISLPFSVPGEVVDGIVALGKKYDLVVYDPQGPAIYWPVGEDLPTPGEMGSALRGGAFGLLLVAAGVLLPIPILRWVMIGVGALLVFFAGYTVAVLRGWIRPPE